MSRYVFKLPDLGEGTVAAEIVGWRVKAGDVVAEDDVIVEVMTDKAAVEVPAPVSGRVLSTTGEPGDHVPVGAELIVFETDAGAPSAAKPQAAASAAPAAAKPQASMPASPAVAKPQAAALPEAKTRAAASAAPVAKPAATASAPATALNGSERVATSPAVRRRAHEAGVDLRQLSGTGPNGRILREDLEGFVSRHVRERSPAGEPVDDRPATQEIKVIGLRRVIAQRMADAKRTIPHFAYVEELDVSELEALRCHLNSRQPSGSPSLTYLPFIALGLVQVLRDFPQCNALYDAERGVIVRHRAVHMGIATQTPDGLKVPVVRDAQSQDLWELASNIKRVTEAARSNKATREELTGSTLTLTSLGKLGGIASTPIINAPEVAIIGVNRAVERPAVYAGRIEIRRLMNLSSSFDHRFVDGHDAAAMIQALKELLEHPATLFLRVKKN